jgi:hypothetical protein
MIFLRYRTIAIFLFGLFLLTQPVCAEDGPSEEQPECLQCGYWQSLNGEIVIINDSQIIIPACGVFDYTIEESKVFQGEHKLSMSLEQTKGSFLCASKKGDAWNLDMVISGHMQDYSTAELNLRQGESTTPILWLSCWNVEREDPCDSGSGAGTSACLLIENSLLYKALSNQIASAYEMLMNKKVRNRPSFNPARFYVTALEFCRKSEKNSGFDAWPEAHASECQYGILKQKYEEFVQWHSCMYEGRGKFSSCKFPTEKFARSRRK